MTDPPGPDTNGPPEPDTYQVKDPKPEFATNDDGRQVADALNDLLQHRLELWNAPFELAVATGYFNPDGFNLVADALERVGRVRLLLGAEPTSPQRALRALDPDVPPSRSERARLGKALQGHRTSIEQDRNLLGFEIEADARTQRLVRWLASGRVEVRRLEQRFLHGKAFLITTHDDGVLAGSSNFTYAGLARNAELNLGHYDPHVVRQVEAWFERQWAGATPFDLAAIYDARFLPHDPYLIYLRMLWELYGAEVEQEAEERGEAAIHLTRFQDDGVWRAKRILDEFGGVVIADGVGLGKTFIAGELMRRVAEVRRQRVLLVAPAALRDGPWASFLTEYGLSRRIHITSYEQLSQDPRLNPDSDGKALGIDFDDVALVLIDEAHAYRNPDTLRSRVLRKLLAGSPRKELALLSATPVNNTLWDLYYLLQYFLHNDAVFADRGIKSLREHFAEAMAESPDELSPKKLFDVLDSVAVRRTRRFVRRYYPHETIRIGTLQVPITFPEPRVVPIHYDLDTVLPGFFARFAYAVSYELDEEGDPETLSALGELPSDGPRLTLARYFPTQFSLEGGRDSQERQLAGLLRSGLLKRFESSSYAFARTCRAMAASHDEFLRILDSGVVPTGEMLADWIATDSDELTEFLALAASRGLGRPAREFRSAELRAAVVQDRDLLTAFAADAERVRADDDPKLDALVATLTHIAERAQADAVGEEQRRDYRKVIIFSYFADTVDWIKRHLERACIERPELEPYVGRIARVTSENGNRTDVLWGFAPKSSKAPRGGDDDRYDILITTDVLAEGVNLQQARHIINYDLPWNPMRLVQRHGRIDRIGSPYDEVFLHCFFPDRQIEVLLGLEERLHAKIARAAASIGIESEVLPGSRTLDVSFSETREEIERLRAEDATLFTDAGESGGALSGEHYRQELREGIEHKDLEREMRRLPWGAGSGIATEGALGFVFCARVGDYPAPQFRVVRYPPAAEPYVLGGVATALEAAHVPPDEPRVLPDAMHTLAYDAWALARADIYADWMEKTDPRNLQPVVPKTLRDAAALVRQHAPPERAKTETEHALDALEQPLGTRIQALVRQAMRESTQPGEQARAVLAVVDSQGIEPSPEPKPLPVIESDDVHLVCWLALSPPSDPDAAE